MGGNLRYVVTDLLCGWVVFMGACLCAMGGAIAASVLGYFLCNIEGWCLVLAVIGGITGCCAGGIAGGSAVGIINSGASTLLVCWAEYPELLKRKHPELHERLNRKAVASLGS